MFFLFCCTGFCGGTNFLNSYTPLTSPHYPQPYPSHLDCVWHIQVGKGLQVVANISTVMLEENYDVLRLYEGECCNRSHQVAQFTGELSWQQLYPSLIVAPLPSSTYGLSQDYCTLMHALNYYPRLFGFVLLKQHFFGPCR